MSYELLLDISVVRGHCGWLLQFIVILVSHSPHDLVSFLFDVVLLCRSYVLLIVAHEIFFVGRVHIFEERVEDGILFLDPLYSVLTVLSLHHVLQVIPMMVQIVCDCNIVDALRTGSALLGFLDLGLKRLTYHCIVGVSIKYFLDGIIIYR